MTTLSIATRHNQAETLPVLLLASFYNQRKPQVPISFDYQNSELLSDGEPKSYVQAKHGEYVCRDQVSVMDNMVESDDPAVKEWITRSRGFANPDFKKVEHDLLELNHHLTLRSYIVKYTLSTADLAVYGAIRGNKAGAAAVKKGTFPNVTRWYKYIEESNPWISDVIKSMNAKAQEQKMAKSEGANYDIALMDTEKGVVTRFPPEPSGYLHIGHAKAALLNDYFAHEKYHGKLICRFDDTNPSKEKEEFQDSIIKDLELMGIKPDKTSYTSDYFQELYESCIRMLKEGKAYADDTDQATMRQQRWDGQASARRNASVEENLSRYEEMKTGSAEGVKWCIRAKISVDDNNKAMRDPVIYRCNPQPHHRTGTKWKMYPIYDFCCPIVDSIEGITHALRTMEYRDRNPQYQWMLDALNLRKVHIWDFSRLNFVRTLLSKRKLAKFVEDGHVWGWDDPRFPTVRGIRRRGMTIPALREYILKQGPSRNLINLDWTTFWATNKKYIDPVAPRHTMVQKKDAVTATVKGARLSPYSEDKPKHGKNPDLGTKKVAYSPQILISQVDARNFTQDEEITLMSWGNAIVRSISHSINPLHPKLITGLELELHLQGDVKKTKQKITWLAKEGQELIPVEIVDFDYLITKDKLEEDDKVEDFLTKQTEFREEGWADGNVVDVKADDIIQFERVGYFRCDRKFEHGKPAVFFNIPTGKRDK